MRAIIVALVLGCGSVASAQCVGGVCFRPARAVVAAPVRAVGVVFHGVRARRAMRVERRVTRRVHRRAARRAFGWRLRGGCCG